MIHTKCRFTAFKNDQSKPGTLQISKIFFCEEESVIFLYAQSIMTGAKSFRCFCTKHYNENEIIITYIVLKRLTKEQYIKLNILI